MRPLRLHARRGLPALRGKTKVKVKIKKIPLSLILDLNLSLSFVFRNPQSKIYRLLDYFNYD